MNDPTTQDLARRLAELEDRVRQDERRSGVETAFWALMANVFPEETRRHMRNAGREQLLAARTYIDHWIAKLGEEGESADEPARRHETIEVE